MKIYTLFRNRCNSFIMTSFLLFITCSKYSSYEQLVPIKIKKDKILSIEQIEFIGELHNKYLGETINMINSFELKNEKITIKEAMLSLDIPELNYKQKENLYEKYSEINYLNIRAKYQNLSKYFFKIDEIFDGFNHHSDIIEGFSRIRQKAIEELSGKDLEKVLILLSIGEKSTKFWLPKDLGGDGLGYEFLTVKNGGLNLGYKENPKWLVVFWHDMFGGLEGAIGWALGVAIAGGPATLIAYLVSIGFGAAAASIKEAL